MDRPLKELTDDDLEAMSHGELISLLLSLNPFGGYTVKNTTWLGAVKTIKRYRDRGPR
jgi:H2-forming N5,N10-methylenetetrahydromethanopterin dehydrogenase-like enzyme